MRQAPSGFRRYLPGAILICLAMALTWFVEDVLLYASRQAGAEMELKGDALGYYQMAMTKDSFYAASVREPLFPYVLRQSILMLGIREPKGRDEILANHLVVRWTTSCIGITLIGLIGILGWKLGGQWCGAISSWMYAASTYALFYAMSGLRETTMFSLFVLLTLLLLLKPKRKLLYIARVSALALVCGVLPLVRLSSLVAVPAIVAAWAGLGLLSSKGGLDKRRILAEAAFYVFMAWFATYPFLRNCRERYGEPFYPMHIHATFWMNHEFAGKPGFPSREEVIEDPYRGRTVSPGYYVFGMHSLPQVVERYAKGYWISFTRHLRQIFSYPVLVRRGSAKHTEHNNYLYWVWLVGLLWSIRLWRTHGLIPLAMLAAQFPFAFIVPLDTVLPGQFKTGVEPRFSMTLAPFVSVLVGLGVVKTIDFLYRRVKKPVRPEGDGATGSSATGKTHRSRGKRKKMKEERGHDRT